MSLPFSATLRQTLLRLLTDQRAQLTDPVIHTHDVVFVSGSMDAQYYLALDGRVLWLDDETPLTVAIEPYHIHATLIKAAERLNLPELQALLPPKPADAVVCPHCHGTHRIIQNLFCPMCAAKGWVRAPT